MSYLRRLPRFEYFAPQNVAAVCDVLTDYPGEARLLAGGTDLVLQMRRRETTPRYVIGLKGVSDLAFIRSQKTVGRLSIGAMTTFRAIERSPLILKNYDFLSHTAAEIGSPEIRCLATIGGNLSGALPCADFPAPLIVLGAMVKLKSRRGERVLPLEDFFTEFERTAAAPDELLTEIQLPPPPKFSGGSYLKFHDRHAMDMTTTGVAASVVLDEARRNLQEVKIVLTASSPIPKRVRKAEAALRGQAFTEEALEEAARLACQEAEPRSSWRARREFRLELIRVLSKRALKEAWGKAKLAADGGRA